MLRGLLATGGRRGRASFVDSPGFQRIEIADIALWALPFTSFDVEEYRDGLAFLDAIQQVTFVLRADEADVLLVTAVIYGQYEFTFAEAVIDYLLVFLDFQCSCQFHRYSNKSSRKDRIPPLRE